MNELETKQLLVDIKKAFEGHTDNVVETIKITVNGKIDRLTENFNDWKKHETEEREKIKVSLDDYIVRTEPMVKFFDDMTSTKRIFFWFLGGLGTIGAFYLMIREILK